jgi:hypothetical protein
MQLLMLFFVMLQILHAYMAEPYAPWSGLARGSRQYQQLKQQRAEQLWGLIDQVGRVQTQWHCSFVFTADFVRVGMALQDHTAR